MNLPPGARAIPDPEAEVERLAAARAALETVLVHRRELDILLAAATALLDADRNGVLDWQLTLPGDFTYADLEDVAKRYGRWR
jgi:hypothetical protein